MLHQSGICCLYTFRGCSNVLLQCFMQTLLKHFIVNILTMLRQHFISNIEWLKYFFTVIFIILHLKFRKRCTGMEFVHILRLLQHVATTFHRNVLTTFKINVTKTLLLQVATLYIHGQIRQNNSYFTYIIAICSKIPEVSSEKFKRNYSCIV